MLNIDEIKNTIICNDCLEVMKQLPDKCVDLVLTDPPYGIGRNNKLRIKNDYDCFEDTPEYIKTVCVPVIIECIRVASTVVLTPGFKNMMMYPQCDGFGTFYQPASVGIQRFGNMDSQPILYYGKPCRQMFGTKCSWQITEPPSCNEHPCSKPIKIWVELLKKLTDEGHTILDPFLGSGTTAVACYRTRRNYIGIEISPEYCKIAEKRIQQEKDKLALFNGLEAS